MNKSEKPHSRAIRMSELQAMINFLNSPVFSFKEKEVAYLAYCDRNGIENPKPLTAMGIW